jgi:hypothetical protein
VVTFQTHGEKWLAAAHARVTGYCKARGWLCGPPVQVSPKQHCIWISDRFGKSAAFHFEMRGDECFVMDEFGLGLELDAETFDAAMGPEALAPKAFHDKRQQPLPLPEPEIEW